jgi:alkylation response protein AidB-like acyl-CoA dehydrogenase
MELWFDEKAEQFRQEVQALLGNELPADWVGPASVWRHFESDEVVTIGQSLAKKLAQKGWLSLCWPKEYGGQGRPFVEGDILTEEIGYRRAPLWPYFLGTELVAPTIIALETDENKKRQFLQPIARGEVVWCELFSEPEAGSDLASVRTRATRQQDSFIINGQKTWATGAHHADWGILLARTGSASARHRGLSLFTVDMKTAGITIRPILSLNGGYDLNEVFFDDVRIPATNLLGEENRGWHAAMVMLGFERCNMQTLAGMYRTLHDLSKYVSENKVLAEDSPLRRKLAELEVKAEVARQFIYYTAWGQDRGLEFESEAAMARVLSGELRREFGAVGVQILKDFGLLKPDCKWAPLKGIIEEYYCDSFSFTISGGTLEIQKNIIALRGLALPRA